VQIYTQALLEQNNLFQEVLKASRAFVMPLNPPRIELEEAVKLILEELGLVQKPKPPRKRSRGRGRTKNKFRPPARRVMREQAVPFCRTLFLQIPFLPIVLRLAHHRLPAQKSKVRGGYLDI